MMGHRILVQCWRYRNARHTGHPDPHPCGRQRGPDIHATPRSCPAIIGVCIDDTPPAPPGRSRCAVVVGGRVVGSAHYTVTPTAAAAQPTPTATAGPQSGGRGRAQPVATSPSGAFAIGDSVMLDAAADLQSHGITVDAAVSRQFDAGLDILRSLAATGRLPRAVVVDLGTNGPISDALFDEMRGVLRGVPRVVFVTVKVPRWWEGEVNS